MESQQHKGPATRVLNTPEAASYLKLRTPTLETWRSRGGGPRFSKLGSRVVYRIEDLDAFLEAGSRTSTSDRAAA
ncbi:helix-turn-helix protein [Panacagrimonas perspica]|uniref:Helix-turn-helix protein n=1 Tax=Panacagrimonas perspica TaxID=381431 RepID=A0A4R7PBD8_9GAMM|nr:helix-turn-helix domain-containing protein [Panacagrimonas perspica]TDU31307.1 helix-turn-helix protein [Panacagrimonas perspica]